MTSTAESTPADVLALLVRALPELDTLTDDQVRGAHCAWCRTPLQADTAINFGEQTSPDPRSTSTIGIRWYPRACPACAAKKAHRALFEHSPGCEECKKVSAPGEPCPCNTARALNRLLKGGY
ncbi:hypothetical protein AB0O68_15790 [Streptomyces sp. NPDC087512]|uniref:hypothetical protein n=1 Tax=Streptomyces sp. NPDC087512 TaxID=3155059 RepID=UPI00343CF445